MAHPLGLSNLRRSGTRFFLTEGKKKRNPIGKPPGCLYLRGRSYKEKKKKKNLIYKIPNTRGNPSLPPWLFPQFLPDSPCSHSRNGAWLACVPIMNHNFPKWSLVSTGIRESLSQAPLFPSDRRHEQSVFGILVAMQRYDWQSFRFAE
jgi:hypothetical protein